MSVTTSSACSQYHTQRDSLPTIYIYCRDPLQEEKIKEQRRERRRERKRRGREPVEEEEEEEDVDPEMAAMMGFSGFGGTKRKAT